MSTPTTPARLQEYWDWFAVALFVLITVDMLTTKFAAARVGSAREVNPFVRWVLGEGILVLTAVNLAATIVAVASFGFLMRLLETSPPPYDRYMARVIELWLGLLVAGGLFVFANNLAVIVHGRAIIGPA